MSNKLYYRDKKIWVLTRNIAIVFLLLGIYLFLTYFTSPKVEYEDFIQDTIKVRSLKFYPGGRYSVGSLILKSDKNVNYSISADYDPFELREFVQPGVEVEIKYVEGQIFHFRYIKELIVDDRLIVKYVDHSKSNLFAVAIISGIIEIIGIGILLLGVWCRKKSHYTNEKTNELHERSRLNKREKLQH